jgi:hypothetical protein
MDVGLIVLSRWDEWWRAYNVVNGGRMVPGLLCCQGRKNVARLVVLSRVEE